MPDATREPAVRASQSRMGEAIDCLENAISNIHERLDPVLHESSQPEADAAKSPRSVPCVLSGDIDDFTERIQDATGKLIALHECTEL